MAAGSPDSAGRQPARSSHAGLTLAVFHATADVQPHIASLSRGSTFQVTAYPQAPLPPDPMVEADAVLWELVPGRRPDLRALRALAADGPLLSYGGSTQAELAERSATLGFAGHLAAPLDRLDVSHLMALHGADDLALRLRQAAGTLRRQARRTQVLTAAHRAFGELLEPAQVAELLALRARAWLPAAHWAVVGRMPDRGPTVLAPSSAGELEAVIRDLGARVIDAGEPLGVPSVREADVSPGGPDVAALVLPLTSRGATVGALVGLDAAPSRRRPELRGVALAAALDLLHPAAVALDNACRIQHAEELSVTDDLTKLYNSRYLRQALRREAKRQVRSCQPLSLLFIDLDGFKGVNDRHGHLNGSRALVEVARIIQDCSRETDVAARYGGDEFAVVLPDTGGEGAAVFAGRVCQCVRDHRFLQDVGIDYRLTASIGVATMPDSATTVEELLRRADEAMYDVKAQGKDGIRFARTGSREGRSA